MKKILSVFLSFVSAASFLNAQPVLIQAEQADDFENSTGNQSSLFDLFFEVYPLESLIKPYQGIQAYTSYLSLDPLTKQAIDQILWEKYHQENLQELVNHSIVLFNLENKSAEQASIIRKQLNLIQDGSFVSVLSNPQNREVYREHLIGVFLSWAEPFEDFKPSLIVPEFPDLDFSGKTGDAVDDPAPMDESDLLVSPFENENDSEADSLPSEDPEQSLPEDTAPVPGTDQDEGDIPSESQPEVSQPVERDPFTIWKDFFELTLGNNSLQDPYFLLSSYRQYITGDDTFRIQVDQYFRNLTGAASFNELFRQAAQNTLDTSTDVKEIAALVHALTPYQDYLHLRFPETGNNSSNSNSSSSDKNGNNSSNSNSPSVNTGPSINTSNKNSSFREVSKTRNLTIKIDAVGTVPVNPDFSNEKAWRKSTSTYNTPLLWGQCTWFAWGRFYELYGYSPGFTGNGYECAAQLIKAHPDAFEMSRTPKAGGVFSSDAAHNHVGIVLGWDAKTELMIIQEGNLDVVSNPNWSEAINDWRTIEISLDQLKGLYGNVIFANPTTQALQVEEEEEIVVTENNSKIADINSLVSQMAPLSISRYQAEIDKNE